MRFVAEKRGHASGEVNAGRGYYEMSEDVVAELDVGNDAEMDIDQG